MQNFNTYKQGFTMAEILLSLTIIGVVAAITLPSLTGNINERTWNTQRKALYSRMSQAIALMPALNGYGTTDTTAAETFVTSGLAKVLKINNICSKNNLSDCGIVSTYTNLANNKKSVPTTLAELNSMFVSSYTDFDGTVYQNPQKDINTNAAAFETQNGESFVVYYNPRCLSENGILNAGHYRYMQIYMCANFIYDLNGKKGPNTVGKDIGFMSVLYASDAQVVAPVPASTNATTTAVSFDGGEVVKLCNLKDNETRLPNKEEIASMFFNRELIGINSGLYWSGSIASPTTTWRQNFNMGTQALQSRTAVTGLVRCVKR